MKIKALCIDNNPVLLKAISEILLQEGCEVHQASTGLQALEILEGYTPDIIFTDLIMPEVDGEQFCRILRASKQFRDIFIVVLSAIVVEDRERILRAVDCDLCIAKGSLKEIRHHIREVLKTFDSLSKSKEDSLGASRIPKGMKPSEVTSELISEKLHLQRILENLDEGVVELSLNGKIISANKAALAILAQSEEQLIGNDLIEAIGWGEHRGEVEVWMQDNLIGQRGEALAILEDRPLELQGKIITVSLLPVSDGGRFFGLCIFREITRQFQAEKHSREMDVAFRLVKKMDALSYMAGGLAHDFNNLLTVICGNLDIVSMQGLKSRTFENERLIGQAKKAALHAVDLTRQISCFSNFGIIKREKHVLQTLVREKLERYFSTLDSSYTLKTGSEDHVVSVDRDEIETSLENILQNCLEAAPGCLVDIRIESAELEKPEIISGQYVAQGSYAKLSVHDQGKGIDPEELFQVFDPYYSSKKRGAIKGMGFGLTVVYAVLRNHGGHAVVESESDRGCTVSLYLPTVELIPVGTYVEGPDIPISENQEIILMEPDPHMREIGSIMFGYLGVEAVLARDREGALAELARISEDDDVKKPAPIVLLDLSEGRGETAVESCRLLHEINKNAKIVAMGGTIIDPIMEDCRQYGFVQTLAKPYTVDSLQHIVRQVASL